MAESEITAKVTKYKRGENPRSLANLVPVPKGVALNPNGNGAHTPKISPIIRRFADMPYSEFAKINPKALTMAELVAWKIYMDAIDDEGYQAGTKSRDTLLDRVDGKPKGDPEAEKGDTNIQIVVTSWPGQPSQ